MKAGWSCSKETKSAISLSKMASGILTTIRPAVIQASAAPGGDRKPDVRGLKSSPASGGGGSWWAPIFGWPSEPDYIDGVSAPEGEEKEPARRFGAFTEEKARKLRRAMETDTFHDVMYHSAIASRLASDVPHRPRH